MNSLLGLILPLASPDLVNGPGGMPAQASTFAAEVDDMYWLINWICVFFFVLIMALMGYFMWKYRARSVGESAASTTDHNTPLELLWSIIPLAIVIYIFYYGFQGYLHIMIPPSDAYEIQVSGQKWSWSFQYPNGYIDKDLHAPADTNVRLVMTSQDVLHSFYIPAFRMKHDVVPGRFTKLWFNATAGDYQVFCAEYCGDEHSSMLARAVIQPRAEFDRWLEDAANVIDKLPPAEAGKLLFTQRGCTQCHSVDGVAGIGPSLKGIFGHQQPLADGSSVLVDENYIRSSILMPQSQVVAGFAPVMPTFQGRLKDKEIAVIAEYIKSLQ